MALSHSLGTSTVINFAEAKLAHRAVPHRPKLIDNRRSAASTLSPLVVRGTVRAIEFLSVTLLGLAIAQLYVDTGVLQNTIYPFATTLVGLATVIGFGMLDLYSLHALSAYVRNMPAAMFVWTATFAALVAGLFFLKIGPDVSRVWLLTWFASGALALMAIRLAAGCFVRAAARSGRLCQRVAIYGTGPVAQGLIEDFEADPNSIVRIAGVYDDRGNTRAPGEISGYPNLGGVDDLIRMSRAKTLDLVIVSLPLAAEARLSHLASRLSVLPAAIKLPARAAGIRFAPQTYSHVGSVAMIDLFDKPISDWHSVSKWLFDKIVGSVALALLAPLMLLIALAVKLESRGPVLFRQKRYGFNNELIEVLKFRSMYIDRCDATASKLVTKNDPRVTRVGRFIRKTSLDELPQLINVVCGSLSLVGPRPHAVKAKAGDQLYDEVVDGYFARHKVKPGITGWAQINGWRGETDTEEKIEKRVEHDLYYIENWSVFLDLSILVKTPFALLKTENAY